MSLLLTDKGHQVILNGLHGKAIALELLMRGSEHGFTKEEFYKRVIGVTPTLSVFRSHLGRVFGGYTKEAWAIGNKNITGTNESFLYSQDSKILFRKVN